MINVVQLYRIALVLNNYKIPIIPKFITFAIRLIFSCWLPCTVKAGKNLVLGYGGLGIVIHHNVTIGNNVHIDQNVTIGGNGTSLGVPIIGDNVYIGAGAKILGPIRIGSGSVIGANAVVIIDVPDCSVAAGVPAKIIRTNIDIKQFLYHKRFTKQSPT